MLPTLEELLLHTRRSSKRPYIIILDSRDGNVASTLQTISDDEQIHYAKITYLHLLFEGYHEHEIHIYSNIPYAEELIRANIQ